MRGLIYNGELVPADVDVVDGREHGLWWAPGDPGTRREPNAGQCMIWHHTAGVGNARTTYRVLDKRGLSVQLKIDLDGTITQYADLLAHCFHAGEANGRGWGVEVASFGVATHWRRMRNILRRKGHRASTYHDMVHGRRIRFFRLLPAQMQAAVRLYFAISHVTALPQRWPTVGDGRVLRTAIDDVQSWRGHLTHFHVSPSKVGITPHVADELAARACLGA